VFLCNFEIAYQNENWPPVFILILANWPPVFTLILANWPPIFILILANSNDKVFLWDVAHVEKGKHSKFQKLWLGPYKIASIIGNNSYFLKDMED
jgi:hypothetical protein